MEDFQLDLIIGEAGGAFHASTCPASRSSAPPRAPDWLTTPLRSASASDQARFLRRAGARGDRVARRAAAEPAADTEGAHEIARRARGTPRWRVAYGRVRDFASVEGSGAVDAKIADRALAQLEVDARVRRARSSLFALHRRELRRRSGRHRDVAAALSEPRRDRGDHRAPICCSRASSRARCAARAHPGRLRPSWAASAGAPRPVRPFNGGDE